VSVTTIRSSLSGSCCVHSKCPTRRASGNGSAVPSSDWDLHSTSARNLPIPSGNGIPSASASISGRCSQSSVLDLRHVGAVWRGGLGHRTLDSIADTAAPRPSILDRPPPNPRSSISACPLGLAGCRNLGHHQSLQRPFLRQSFQSGLRV
jgi:hypothetical protein